MEEVRVGFEKLSFAPRPPQPQQPLPKLLSKARRLLGVPDADSWYQRHTALFTHPRFTEELVQRTDDSVARMMQRIGADKNTVWAHTHPDWNRSFGVWIVRRGSEIIYEGRREVDVEHLLGLRAAL